MAVRLFAYLSYRDAPAALRWLEVVGFRTTARQDGDDGRVLHSEVRLGDAVLMVASHDADYGRAPLVGRSTGQGLYLLVDDVDALYARALTAGAESVIAPEDTEWGTRRCRVLDPQGVEWSFGTYVPGRRPGSARRPGRRVPPTTHHAWSHRRHGGSWGVEACPRTARDRTTGPCAAGRPWPGCLA